MLRQMDAALCGVTIILFARFQRKLPIIGSVKVTPLRGAHWIPGRFDRWPRVPARFHCEERQGTVAIMKRS